MYVRNAELSPSHLDFFFAGRGLYSFLSTFSLIKRKPQVPATYGESILYMFLYPTTVIISSMARERASLVRPLSAMMANE